MDNYISEMPLLPMRGLVLFPGMVLHFDLGRKTSIRAAEKAMANDEPIFLVTQIRMRDENPAADMLFEIGVIATVKQILRLPGEDVRVLVEGRSRGRLLSVSDEGNYRTAQVEELIDDTALLSEPRYEALYRPIVQAFEEYTQLAPRMPHEVMMNILGADDLGKLCDYIAQSIQLRFQTRQRILSELDIAKRATDTVNIINNEKEVLNIGQKIQRRVKTQMDRNQRDYYLREQMRAIEEELGEYSEEGGEGEENYAERVKKLGLDKESEKHVMKEVSRLSKMQPSSPEANVITTYLDYVLDLPWNTKTKEKIDLVTAKKQLDRDHYGMEKVKERIMEFMAVRKLNPELRGQVICLVGPPGVGKTSVGMSIAKALGRKYARLSLGGVRDEADIRGHRKTYVGAMPGRIMTALTRAGSSNALLLLDEVDKLGSDYRGDPSAALLEVLDTAQNNTFRDHFIEIPFDLSDVMFICTANDESAIPRPLLDRMEVIEMPGYTDEEKLHIGKNHLYPRQLEKHGINKNDLRISDSAMADICRLYTREAGVRELERELGKICRQAAKKIAEQEEHKRITVTNKNLGEFLGTPIFQRDYVNAEDEVGVVNGLAWTSVGGEMLQVEVNVVDGTGHLELTGNLGDVMKESARAAVTYIRSRAKVLGLEPDFYKKYDIHIHFPESAIPKDGPSAGVTITTAVTSALTGIPVRHDIAMTGEVSIRGRVLPIGGLREKTMAAFRAGMTTVIIPKANEKDLADIVPAVREGLKFVIADNMDTVLENALVHKPAEEKKAENSENTFIPPCKECKEVNTIRQ